MGFGCERFDFCTCQDRVVVSGDGVMVCKCPMSMISDTFVNFRIDWPVAM